MYYRADELLRDTEADLERCKHSLLEAVAERDQLRAETQRLQQELTRYEAEIARLRECRDKAASLMHLANQAIYGLP